MSKKIKMDSQGYNDLLQEIADAEKELNNIRLFNQKTFSRDYASDDPETDEAILTRRLKHLKSTLNNVEIVESLNAKDCVDIGSTVKLLLDFGYETDEGIYTLIAHNNIKANEISINSPLGTAIFGKKANDVAEYTVGNNIIKATILELVF